MPNRATREESRHRERAARLAITLRTRRAALGMSQQQLAVTAGVAIGTVRAIETSQTVEPGFFTILEMARALSLDTAQLLHEMSADAVKE